MEAQQQQEQAGEEEQFGPQPIAKLEVRWIMAALLLGLLFPRKRSAAI